MAINFYLARKYGNGKLWVNCLEDEALIYKWTFYAITQLETACVDLILHRKVYDEKDRNIEIIQVAEQKLIKPLRVLNEYLVDKDFWWLINLRLLTLIWPVFYLTHKAGILIFHPMTK